MNETARWNEIADAFRPQGRLEPLAPQLREAVLDYLAGRGSLAAIRRVMPPYWSYQPWLPLPLSPAENDALDAFDLRLFEICLAFRGAGTFFSRIAARRDAVKQAHAHLLALEPDLPARLRYLLAAYPSAWFVLDRPWQIWNASLPLKVLAQQWQMAAGRPTALGRLIQSYLPEHLDLIFASNHPITTGMSAWPGCCSTWSRPRSTAPGSLLGTICPRGRATMRRCCWKRTPERFTGWAREIVAPDSAVGDRGHLVALHALLAHDPARHLDLAIQAARTPTTGRSWYETELQKLGLTAALRQDLRSLGPGGGSNPERRQRGGPARRQAAGRHRPPRERSRPSAGQWRRVPARPPWPRSICCWAGPGQAGWPGR